MAIFGELVQCISIIAAWYSEFGSFVVLNNRIVSATANLSFDAVQMNVLQEPLRLPDLIADTCVSNVTMPATQWSSELVLCETEMDIYDAFVPSAIVLVLFITQYILSRLQLSGSCMWSWNEDAPLCGTQAVFVFLWVGIIGAESYEGRYIFQTEALANVSYVSNSYIRPCSARSLNSMTFWHVMQMYFHGFNAALHGAFTVSSVHPYALLHTGERL